MNKEFDFYDRTCLKSYNLNETMRYQLSMLDSLDAFTRKHCENVAAITCRLCQYLGKGENFTIYCTICAFLHDIGKLFIPPSILQSHQRLTPEQYEIMKTHTTIGYNMCIKDPKLRNFAAGPIYHHEALDGSGYPHALTQKNIPIEGQIIRVADEYDALVSKRQYKSHKSISETLQILVDDAKPNNKPLDPNKNPSFAFSRKGKINKKVLIALFKVVIDDTNYEINCIKEYITYLKENVSRLKLAINYFKKYQKTHSKQKKEYYLNGINSDF